MTTHFRRLLHRRPGTQRRFVRLGAAARDRVPTTFSRTPPAASAELHPARRPGGEQVRMINAAAMTAFLTWFGGGGLLLERLAALAAGSLRGRGGDRIERRCAHQQRHQRAGASRVDCGVADDDRRHRPSRHPDPRPRRTERSSSRTPARAASPARSDNGRAIAKGTEVIVTRYERGIAYVATWNELSP